MRKKRKRREKGVKGMERKREMKKEIHPGLFCL